MKHQLFSLSPVNSCGGFPPSLSFGGFAAAAGAAGGATGGAGGGPPPPPPPVMNQGIGLRRTHTEPPCYKGNKRRTRPFGFPTG